MKLFLYSSYLLSSEHSTALAKLVGKESSEISFAAITNAADVFADSQEWIDESIDSLKRLGAQVEVVDLRNWRDNRMGLREELTSKDAMWLCGGHTYYLRWILKETGADEMIKELVQQGKVYVGWSAGAIMAGPTLQHFEIFDALQDAPEVIRDGLGLTNVVVIPHTDLPEFAEGMKSISQQFNQAGYSTVPLTEAQALIINGDEQKVI
jgi:dipeptidase E